MSEIVQRRLSSGNLPDLFLVDGGKGHLSSVKRVLDRQKNPDIPEVVSIAKPNEDAKEKWDRIYLPGRKNPLALKPGHPVLLMMMRIRDEAHRRAVSYHRNLMKRNLTASQLDLIPGIGIKRKKILLKHFKDINAIARASADEVSQVPGFYSALAENVCSFFKDGEARKMDRRG
jgi:excinuclease ABC subunit C